MASIWIDTNVILSNAAAVASGVSS